MDTLDLVRLVLARDLARPLATASWDAAAWEAVHRAIVAWDAAPLAYAAARATGIAAHVPPELLAEWRRDHTATTAVNLGLAFEVEALGTALAASGARSVPLKGTALFLLGVYRDPGARPTNDIDLLVVPEEGPIVDRVLRARGYSQMRVGGPKHWPPYLRDGLMVEVHEHAFWSMSDGHRVSLPEVLARGGGPALGPTIAHLLHHLFESSVTTPWLVVKTLADLAEVKAFCEARERSPDVAGQRSPDVTGQQLPNVTGQRSPDLTHPQLALEIADAARRFGLGRRLAALSGLLARATERPVPEVWLRDRRDGDVDALLRRCAPQSRLFEQALRLPDRAAAFARMPMPEKTALLRYHLFPPAEAMRALYGLPPRSPWVWPLYPLRPAHLLARSALDAARLLVRRK